MNCPSCGHSRVLIKKVNGATFDARKYSVSLECDECFQKWDHGIVCYSVCVEGEPAAGKTEVAEDPRKIFAIYLVGQVSYRLGGELTKIETLTEGSGERFLRWFDIFHGGRCVARIAARDVVEITYK